MKVNFTNKKVTKFLNKHLMQFIQVRNVANPECLIWPHTKQSSIKFTGTAPF